jgi:Uma2 family endonuclease
MSVASSLITASEFARMPDPGHPQELVRGVVIDMPPPKPRHNQICGNVFFQLRLYADKNQLGHVLPNDTGVITEHDPDSVRGPDVMFISYAKVPSGPLPPTYFTVAPDAVFEVRSAGDRWSELHRKVAEYLLLGVPAVYVLDPETSRVHCFYPDDAQQILEASDEFVGVGPLSGFRVPVARFFD